MPHIKVYSGINWHYDIEGRGEHLLFLHGWGVDKRIWRQQSKFFSQYYRVMTIDLPGHGKSGWKKINLDAVIKRLVFVGSMPKFSRSADYPHGLDVNKMRKLGGQLDSDYPSVVNVFFRSLFTREERQTRRFKWLQKFRQFEGVPMKQALVEYLDILEQEDLREVLKKVHVPIQFINGRDDEICNKETVTFLKKVRPESRFDFFEQCGHFPFLSKPYEFNQVVEEFLKGSTL